jgi:hypothetical protein
MCSKVLYQKEKSNMNSTYINTSAKNISYLYSNEIYLTICYNM